MIRFLIISLVLVSCSSYSDDNLSEDVAKEEYKIYYSDSIKISEGKLVNSKPFGTWKFYYKNGKLKFVIDYRPRVDSFISFFDINGNQLIVNGSGEIVFYFENTSKIKRQEKIKGGLKDGISISWHENGNKKHKGYYKEGVKDSIWIYWKENGAIQETGYYKDGLKNGDWKIYSEYNDLEFSNGKFMNGLRIGKWANWYEIGKKSSEGYYIIKEGELDIYKGQKLAVRDGAWIKWSKAGIIIDTLFYERGELVKYRDIPPLQYLE